jgi:hypothetical protein
MAELTIKLPDAKTPGYLRRLMQAEKHQKAIKDGSADYDELVEYLLIFVIEPEDRDEARNTLLDASFEQYIDILKMIGRPPETDENPT